MIRRRDFVGLGLAALASPGACGGAKVRPVDFAEVTRNYQADDYARVLDAWSRHGKLVTDSGTVLEAWGTFKSWDFRQAYIEYYASIYNISDAERKALRQAQLEAARRSYEFHVIAQSTNYKWNDLEKILRDESRRAPSSPWRVALVDATGAEIGPDAIETPKLPELYETQFFPARNAFSKTYLMRFHRDRGEPDEPRFAGDASGRIILRVFGPSGRVELVWQGV